MPQSTDQIAASEVADSGWKGLYVVGAAAALIAVAVFRRYCGTELVTFRGFGIIDVPPAWPGSALDWFALLQSDRLVGLVLLDVVDLVNYALVGLILLALYGALRRTAKSAMVIATASGLVGIAIYMASNQAVSMLVLSDRYAAATTETQRATILATGEALLAITYPGAGYQGTGAYLGLFFVLLAGLIASTVMLRSSDFGRATAVTGMLANGLGLSYFVVLALAPAISWLPPSLSAPFRMVWYVLIAIKLFRLARAT